MFGLICKLVGGYVIGKDVIVPLAIIITDEIESLIRSSQKNAKKSSDKK